MIDSIGKKTTTIMLQLNNERPRVHLTARASSECIFNKVKKKPLGLKMHTPLKMFKPFENFN